MTEASLGFVARIVKPFITSRLSPLILIASLLMGLAALLLTPREEEPQIVVPVMDILVEAPGASVDAVEKLVATPLERKLWEIPGVEYVYSMSMPGRAIATVRYYVGEDREDSLLKTWSKMMSNRDLIPPFVTNWTIKPVEIDDVPILLLTLSSPDPAYSTYELRRVAEELVDKIGQVADTGKIWISGGERRTLRIDADPAKLAAYQITLMELMGALSQANFNLQAGEFDRADRRIRLEAGPFWQSLEQAADTVIAQHDGRPVYLREVAQLEDGPAEVETYTRIGYGPQTARSKRIAGPEAAAGEGHPAVTIAVPKRRGANAVTVARDVIAKVESLHGAGIPSEVTVTITRDYGETANDKVNELIQNLFIAIALVVAVLAIALGVRQALIVAIAVPVTFGITLFLDYLFGYTINRVTLFALVLSLGLLVDDPIVNMENINRHFRLRKEPPLQAALTAVDEVLPPTIFTTLTAIVSFLPMAFITGMMGPYMGPMAFNVPIALTISTVVAITITPWLSFHLLQAEYGKTEAPFDIHQSPIYRWYRRILGPLIRTPARSGLFLGFIALLFAGACLLTVVAIPLKLLPFDNKNELQLVIDMPRGASLERTDALARDLEEYLATVNEVTDFETFVGLASPMDFNGLVRHYYLRRGSHQGDIRITLVHKHYRRHQSHELALRIRPDIQAIAARRGASVKIVETPPGPPVIATVVAEVYGPPGGSYDDLVAATQKVRDGFDRLDILVDVDDFIDEPQARLDFRVNQAKAALHGISVRRISETIAAALGGGRIGLLHAQYERQPAPVILRLQRPLRSHPETLASIRIRGADDRLIPLGELGHFEEESVPVARFHKNLRPVGYVIGELAGRAPVEAVIALTRLFEEHPLPQGYDYTVRGEGEWKLTVDVFRDLGLAFGAALLVIYVILVIQTDSLGIPGVIMLAIPLTIIGIMPGFWLLNLFAGSIGHYPNPVFFTATAMIGMIALAGIVVRNSILLIDFTQRLQAEGLDLIDALIEAGAVRLKPILLTALTTLFGALVITLDPIFSGLAWSFIFGILASTSFTLLVIPVVYYLLNRKRAGIDAQPSKVMG